MLTIRKFRHFCGSANARIISTACVNYSKGGNHTGQTSIHSTRIVRVKGIDILRDPFLNKGMAFTLKERQANGLQGLLPPAVIEQDQQVYRCMTNFHRQDTDLDKHMYLMGLQDRNEKLFYRLLNEYVEQMMPIVYTPTVGLACQKFGMIYRRPRGIYLAIHDRGHLFDILGNWPEDDVKAVVVTDGERILGLGDLGAYGMGIPGGKLSLYTALGGIDPERCLPILLDVGTNNPKLLKDPLYTGLRQQRVRGAEYDDFIDEFMQAVWRRYGKQCLVQFEDFAAQNAFRLLEKYRENYLMFNDDIQGTASVAVGGILASLRITKTMLKDNVFLFQGAGGAATGIALLLVKAMMQCEGLTEEEAVSRIWMVDVDGLLSKNRTVGEFTPHNGQFAKDVDHMTNLEEIVRFVKPTAIIGAAAVAGTFTPNVLRTMAANNERPIVFALSNPTSKSECSAAEAYQHTEGRCVFASGSPFPSVEVDYKVFTPSQGNNAYIFPGVALASILFRLHRIPEEIFLVAAQAVAKAVSEKQLEEGQVYPPIREIPEVTVQVTAAIGEYAYKAELASTYPKPEDFVAYIRSKLYTYEYLNFTPPIYDWPTTASV